MTKKRAVEKTRYTPVVQICDSDDDFETVTILVPTQDLDAKRSTAVARKRPGPGPLQRELAKRQCSTHASVAGRDDEAAAGDPDPEYGAAEEFEQKTTQELEYESDDHVATQELSDGEEENSATVVAGEDDANADDAAVTEWLLEMNARPHEPSLASGTGRHQATIDLRALLADSPRWVITGNVHGVTGEWRRPSSDRLELTSPAVVVPTSRFARSAPPAVAIVEPEAPLRSARPATMSRRLLTTAAGGDTLSIAEWPSNVIHVRDNYNPHRVTFQNVVTDVGCDCASSCRVDTCPNARRHIFCGPLICPYDGVCGNGTEQVRGLAVARHEPSGEYTLVATAAIPAEVVLGDLHSPAVPEQWVSPSNEQRS